MPLIYRAMLRDGDRPKIGPSKSMLGVKVGNDWHDDIAADENDNVHPAAGGMSVAPAWRVLPAHRIPKRLRSLCPQARGSNQLECWRMGAGPFESGAITDELRLTVDSARHGVVGPATVLSRSAYEAALAATADQWTIDPETVWMSE